MTRIKIKIKLYGKSDIMKQNIRKLLYFKINLLVAWRINSEFKINQT